MNEATKNRLRVRLSDLIDSLTEQPQTIDEWETLVLDLRERCAQAALDEIGKEISQEISQEIDASTPSKAPPVPEVASPPNTVACSCKLPCPHCGKSAWYKGDRVRQVVMLVGSLTVKRRYFGCRHCKSGFCPADAALGVVSGSSLTLRVQQEIAYLSGCLPYSQASQTLQRLTGVTVSSRTAQRLCVGQAGAVARAFEEAQEAALLPLAYERTELLTVVAPELPQPDVVYTVADGIQTPMRDGSWREMKVGAVQSRYRDGRVDQPTRYVCHLGGSERFGKHWEALGIGGGSLGAERVVVLGDGAAWLWRQAEEHFPCATHILDFFHALEYVGAVARAAFGEGEKAASVSRKWLSEQASEMKRSQWDKVRNSLKAVRAWTSAAEEAVDTALRYFRNHAERMDYARYLREGLSIGSGLAESSCKRLVTQRLKGSGMRWSETGAQAVGSLRSFHLGDDGNAWNTFCDYWKNYRLINQASKA